MPSPLSVPEVFVSAPLSPFPTAPTAVSFVLLSPSRAAPATIVFAPPSLAPVVPAAVVSVPPFLSPAADTDFPPSPPLDVLILRCLQSVHSLPYKHRVTLWYYPH